MAVLSTSIQQQASLDIKLNVEQQAQQLIRNVGVCFSGGGSRALSATMGQLRGLSETLGSNNKPWIDQVGTLSSVSGGCWASSLYTFLPASISYDEFLNVSAEPSTLTWSGGDIASNINYLPANNLGQVPTRLGWEELFEEIKLFLKLGYPEQQQWWRAAIGNLVFKPFGLYQPDLKQNPTKYFGWQEFYFDRVTKPFNPLTKTDMHFARNTWPFLTMNAAMFYPDLAGTEELVPFFSTLQQGGVLGSFPQESQSGVEIGGGTMQPFALGSQFQSIDQNGRVTVDQTRPFSLVDMAAMSSTAFAAELENKHSFSSLVPEYTLWPVKDGGSTGQTFKFADGGNIENSGLANLIATTLLKKVVVFINSSEGVEHDLSTWNYTQIPATIPPLFGYQPIDGIFDSDGYRPYAGAIKPSSPLMKHNQVFPSSRFQELLDGLKTAINKGQDTALFFQKALPVQLNSWYGITETRDIDVLWVCNNRVKSWEAQITDRRIKDELSIRDVPDTALWKFPLYSTLEQLHLSACQVNMLAHLSCWNVTTMNNRSEWEKIFS